MVILGKYQIEIGIETNWISWHICTFNTCEVNLTKLDGDAVFSVLPGLTA